MIVNAKNILNNINEKYYLKSNFQYCTSYDGKSSSYNLMVKLSFMYSRKSVLLLNFVYFGLAESESARSFFFFFVRRHRKTPIFRKTGYSNNSLQQ